MAIKEARIMLLPPATTTVFAVDGLTPRPTIPFAYRLGRAFGWAVASVADAYAAAVKAVTAAPR